MNVLFDLNVILDVLQQRQPFYPASAAAMALAERGQVAGLVAAHSLSTLFHLAAKSGSPESARVILSTLLQVLRVAAVDQAVIEDALRLPYRDFEDALQMAAAVEAGAAYVVTRDLEGFRHGPLPALQPVELVALASGAKGAGAGS